MKSKKKKALKKPNTIELKGKNEIEEDLEKIRKEEEEKKKRLEEIRKGGIEVIFFIDFDSLFSNIGMVLK